MGKICTFVVFLIALLAYSDACSRRGSGNKRRTIARTTTLAPTTTKVKRNVPTTTRAPTTTVKPETTTTAQATTTEQLLRYMNALQFNFNFGPDEWPKYWPPSVHTNHWTDYVLLKDVLQHFVKNENKNCSRYPDITNQERFHQYLPRQVSSYVYRAILEFVIYRLEHGEPRVTHVGKYIVTSGQNRYMWCAKLASDDESVIPTVICKRKPTYWCVNVRNVGRTTAQLVGSYKDLVLLDFGGHSGCIDSVQAPTQAYGLVIINSKLRYQQDGTLDYLVAISSSVTIVATRISTLGIKYRSMNEYLFTHVIDSTLNVVEIDNANSLPTEYEMEPDDYVVLFEIVKLSAGSTLRLNVQPPSHVGFLYLDSDAETFVGDSVVVLANETGKHGLNYWACSQDYYDYTRLFHILQAKGDCYRNIARYNFFGKLNRFARYNDREPCPGNGDLYYVEEYPNPRCYEPGAGFNTLCQNLVIVNRTSNGFPIVKFQETTRTPYFASDDFPISDFKNMSYNEFYAGFPLGACLVEPNNNRTRWENHYMPPRDLKEERVWAESYLEDTLGEAAFFEKKLLTL